MRIPIIDLEIRTKAQAAGFAAILILSLAAVSAPALTAYTGGQMAFQQRDSGNAARDAGNYQQAVRYLQRSVDIMGDGHPEYQMDLALTHHEMGNYQRAIKEYSQIINTDPNHIPALIGRATSYEATGAHALADYDRQTAARVYPR